MDLTDILDKKGIYYKKSNNPNEILIRCTSGNHEDSSPSLSYNIEKNIFNCWACGFRGGKLKFLNSIGINTDIPFDSKQPYKIEKLKQKLHDFAFSSSLEIPDDARFIKGTFRNISSSTIQKFQAFFTDKFGLTDYVCFPIYQFGKLRFIEGRYRFSKDTKPKYYRRPNNAKTSDILFPLDMVQDRSHLILVEGLFDMLNLWDKGYENVVCVFGTSNFSYDKLDILDKIGTLSVELMFDGDQAGFIGAQRVSALLEKRDIKNSIIELPAGLDPGMLTKDQLLSIMRRR